MSAMFSRNFKIIFQRCARQFQRDYNLGFKFRSFSNYVTPKQGPFVLLWIPTITTVHTFGWSRDNANKPNLSKVDHLFDENKFEEIRQELTPHKDSNDAEVLWRLARSLYKLSKVASDKEKNQLIAEGMIYAEKALQLAPNLSPVHKWYGILLDAKSVSEGIKARITVTEKVKHHMLKAVEINPKDATTFYMLGLWCYEVTILPWYQRQIASAIFATPPTSSYEEALAFCDKAEKISPNFFSLNLLLIGKIYDKMGQKDKAISYVKRARDYPAATEDDRQANKEAAEILKSWGVK